MSRARPTFILLFLCLLTASADTVAQQRNLVSRENFWHKRGYFLARFGFISGEVVRLDGREVNGQPGATFGVGLDFRTAKHLLMGIAADIHRIHVADSGQYFFDIGLTAKRPFFSEYAKVAFQPGIAVGFGVMDYFVGVEQTAYLTWKGTFETIFFTSAQNAWYLDVGMMGTAFGGNARHKMRFGPFPYLRGGVMF